MKNKKILVVAGLLFMTMQLQAWPWDSNNKNSSSITYGAGGSFQVDAYNQAYTPLQLAAGQALVMNYQLAIAQMQLQYTILQTAAKNLAFYNLSPDPKLAAAMKTNAQINAITDMFNAVSARTQKQGEQAYDLGVIEQNAKIAAITNAYNTPTFQSVTTSAFNNARTQTIKDMYKQTATAVAADTSWTTVSSNAQKEAITDFYTQLTLWSSALTNAKNNAIKDEVVKQNSQAV